TRCYARRQFFTRLFRIKSRRPKIFVYLSGIDADRFCLSLRDLKRYFARHASYVSFELPYTGFACITRREQLNSRIAERKMSRFESVFLNLPWQQIAFGYLQLLHIAVAGQGNYFHAIAERWWDRSKLIRSGDEENARKIK